MRMLPPDTETETLVLPPTTHRIDFTAANLHWQGTGGLAVPHINSSPLGVSRSQSHSVNIIYT